MLREGPDLNVPTGETCQRAARAATVARPITFVRHIFCALLALGVTAVGIARVSAGSVTYTWIEDDGQSVTGHLTVRTPLSVPGEITLPTDVTSFAFSTTPGDFDETEIVGDGPISVDAQFFPTGSPSTTNQIVANLLGDVLELEFDNLAATTSSELWEVATPPKNFNGVGHWAMLTASVPEPSSAVLASIAAAGGLAYRWRRRRHRAGTSKTGPPGKAE